MIRFAARFASVFLALSGTVIAASEPGKEYFARGGIDLFSSSHQDIAWMDTPHACMLFRVNQCIAPSLRLMAKDPNFSFVMENMLNLTEYLEEKPGDRALVERLTRDGRLEWGATFNQPYEDLLSTEELVRETYFGRRWLKRLFPGADARVAFNPDVPGRTLQMPQILAKAGVPYIVISRYHEGLYRWFAPDGSNVLVYTPGHYTQPMKVLDMPVAQAVPALAARLAQRTAYYEARSIPPELPMLRSEDFSEPKDLGPLLTAWSSAHPDGPALRYSSAHGFFEKIDVPNANFDRITGHRPNLWLYIGGPTHHWAISAKREGAALLTAAETFSTARSLLDGHFRAYPSARFGNAWREQIYPDHGWGGKNGHVTDIVFKEKSEFARDEAHAMLGEALDGIARRIKAKTGAGVPVVVFNPLSWSRSDAVILDAQDLGTANASLIDPTGAAAPCQTTGMETPDEINVALAATGAHASADSAESPDSGADKVIDGGTSHLETERWVSAQTGSGPHWVVIDFGRPRTVHRVVLHHEGSLGKFRDIDEFNTTDFELQSADSPAGPWADLVAPVRGNTAVLTRHEFAPKAFRYLRVFITRAAAKEGEPARLFEVEAFSRVSTPAAKIVCVASDVPGTGYKVYYAGPTRPAARLAPAAPANVLEDQHYRITLAPGGVSGIFDKALGKELLETGKFLGGEVFTMQSVGNGAGEFTEVQQPTMERFDKSSAHGPRWRIVEDGPVRKVAEFTSDWGNVVVRERLVLWHPIKRIDFEVALLGWNGERYREFRVAWPIRSPNAQVAYEVPAGVVEVGKTELQTTGGLAYDNVNYTGFIPEIRPREVRDFINVSGEGFGVTLSTSVSVFDYRDPSSDPLSYPVIQPILLASRKSCHSEGNWYLQAGDHFYHFSFTSHSPGWRNGYREGLAANRPLFPVVDPGRDVTASLPESFSFFSVSSPNLLWSTIKKAEDDDSVVVRLYDMEGRDSTTAIRAFVPVTRAERTNLIEEQGQPAELEGGAIRLRVGHHGIETFRFWPAALPR